MNMYYYYCKFDTFKAMLKSKNLWLSDLTKSNDSEEVLRTYKIIWERLRVRLLASDLDAAIVESQMKMLDSTFHIQSIVDVPYGCCFCSESDLVQQWNEYGDYGRGLSIGFDLDWFVGLNRQYPITSSNIKNAIGYEAVIYDSERFEHSLFSICYEAIKQLGNQAWLMAILPTFKHYAGFVKNPSFRDEKETRIVFYPDEHFDDSLDILSGLTNDPWPHCCLSWMKDSSSALRTITIGYDCKNSKDDISELIKLAGVKEDICYFTSECSYRKRLH